VFYPKLITYNLRKLEQFVAILFGTKKQSQTWQQNAKQLNDKLFQDQG